MRGGACLQGEKNGGCGIDVGLELALKHMLLIYFQTMRDFGV